MTYGDNQIGTLNGFLIRMSSESGGHDQLSIVERSQPYYVEDQDLPPLEPVSAGEKVVVVNNVHEEKNDGQSLEDEVCDV